jgi:hypothetical protein
MNRKHVQGVLLLAAASLFAVGAYAQNPHAAPQGKANAADPATKADKDKGEKKELKAADDKVGAAAGAGKETGLAKGKSVEERAERKAKEHDAQRQKLSTMLKAPMTETLKQELKRHAERVARLERIKVVAETEKDKDTAEKATKLLAKENERHEKSMSKVVAATEPAAGAVPAFATPGATPAAAGTQGGAK